MLLIAGIETLVLNGYDQYTLGSVKISKDLAKRQSTKLSTVDTPFHNVGEKEACNLDTQKWSFWTKISQRPESVTCPSHRERPLFRGVFLGPIRNKLWVNFRPRFPLGCNARCLLKKSSVRTHLRSQLYLHFGKCSSNVSGKG